MPFLHFCIYYSESFYVLTYMCIYISNGWDHFNETAILKWCQVFLLITVITFISYIYFISSYFACYMYVYIHIFIHQGSGETALDLIQFSDSIIFYCFQKFGYQKNETDRNKI